MQQISAACHEVSISSDFLYFVAMKCFAMTQKQPRSTRIPYNHILRGMCGICEITYMHYRYPPHGSTL